MIADTGIAPTAFEGADEVWNKFQQKLSQFVNSSTNGNGSATINADFISRPDWEQYREVIKGNAEISSLPNFEAPCD